MSNKLTLSQTLALAAQHEIAPLGSNTLTPFQALQLAVVLVRGQSAMGRICKKAQPTVWKWLQTSKRLPPEHVLVVEAETGISKHLLRPDIYPPALPTEGTDPGEECGDILLPARVSVACDRKPKTQRKDVA